MFYRKDANYLWRFIELTNAYIHYTYGDDEIIICDNSKLDDLAFWYTGMMHLLDARW